MKTKISFLLMGTLFFLFLSGDLLAFSKGDRVLGQWSDGRWYPARIAEVTATKFQINFDDGDVATVPAAKLKKVDWKVGTRVQCNWKMRGKYYPGKIATMSGEVIQVHYDDGDKEKITISRCRTP